MSWWGGCCFLGREEHEGQRLTKICAVIYLVFIFNCPFLFTKHGSLSCILWKELQRACDTFVRNQRCLEPLRDQAQNRNTRVNSSVAARSR